MWFRGILSGSGGPCGCSGSWSCHHWDLWSLPWWLQRPYFGRSLFNRPLTPTSLLMIQLTRCNSIFGSSFEDWGWTVVTVWEVKELCEQHMGTLLWLWRANFHLVPNYQFFFFKSVPVTLLCRNIMNITAYSTCTVVILITCCTTLGTHSWLSIVPTTGRVGSMPINLVMEAPHRIGHILLQLDHVEIPQLF